MLGPRAVTAAAATPLAPSQAKKIRVVVAKPGLDGHDRGAKIIARALRDAGMEVIYTGLHQTPGADRRDRHPGGRRRRRAVDPLGRAHDARPAIVELLREQEIDDVLVTVGGTIPADDIPELKALGVAEVFTPGAPTQDIIDFIRGAVPTAPRPSGRGRTKVLAGVTARMRER